MKKANITLAVIIAVTLVNIYSCYRPDKYLVPCKDIFGNVTISLSADTVAADGQSLDTIIIKLPITSDTVKSKLLLTTTSGTFVESGTRQLFTNFSTLDSELVKNVPTEQWIIKAHLMSSPSAGPVTLSFEFVSYSCIAPYNLYFKQVIPDTLSLSATPFFVVIDSSTTVQVTAKLKVNAGGTASKGATVNFGYITPSDTLTRFRFQSLSAKSDTTGSATTNIIYFDKDTADHAPLGVYATIKNSKGNIVKTTGQIYVIPN